MVMNNSIESDKPPRWKIWYNFWKGQAKYWINEELFAVGLWGFGGGAIRLAGYRCFDSIADVQDDDSSGPFSQIFFAQPFLFANFIGSFVMAILYIYKDEIVSYSPHLYKGVTTGFCGSLTSFAAWIGNANAGPFRSYNWYKIIAMLMLEFWMTWSAFIFGFAVARYVKRFYPEVFPKAPPLTPPPAPVNAGGAAAPVTTVAQNDGNNKSNRRSKGPSSLPMTSLSLSSTTSIIHRDTFKSGQRKTDLLEALKEDEKNEEDEDDDEGSRDEERGRSTGARSQSYKKSSHSVHAAKEALVAASSQETTPASPPPPPFTPPSAWFVHFKQHEWYYWCIGFFLVATPLWITLIFLPEVHWLTENSQRRDFFRAVCLIPFGVWFRWGLGRFPSITSYWPEMCTQTLIANLFAVFVSAMVDQYSPSTWAVSINFGMSLYPSLFLLFINCLDVV